MFLYPSTSRPRGGGPQFPRLSTEHPRPRETTQPLSPTSAQCQTCPELRCTKVLSISYSVHPEIPQTISISRILSLTNRIYVFRRHIFHCLPTENTPLFLPTYPHENCTVGVKLLIPFPFAIIYGYLHYFHVKLFCVWNKSQVSVLLDLAGIFPAFPTTLKKATISFLKIKPED